MSTNPTISGSSDDECDATVVVDVATETAVVIPGYEVIETLGRGGMGMVYLARQLDVLDREVALKTILPKHEDQMFRRYFLKEGQRQAQLHHPNILPIFTAGEAGEMLYLSMFYARDGSLRDRIDAGTLSTQQSVEVICDVLAALDHAHNDLDAPLAHLDVKPENILFDGDNVFLADFGIAKTLAEDATIIAGAAGDPRYWPPEQQSNEATTKSDLYALGIMFYEMLSGSRPGPELKTITSRAQEKALAKTLPAAARPFAPLIAQCLNPNPDQRPDAKPMRRELRELLNPRRISRGMIAAALSVLVIGIALSQPVVREVVQDRWAEAFPAETHPMTFSISPVSGQLWLDGQEETLRTFPLPEGEHRVVAVAEAHVGKTALIEVSADAGAVSLTLEPIPDVSDAEFQEFFRVFDGSDQSHAIDWSDPALQNVVDLDRFEDADPTAFGERLEALTALAAAGDAVAATSLFYAAFEGIAVPGGPKPLMQGLINASEEGYAAASLLRALFVIQSLLEAEQTFNDNPHAFGEVEELLTRAATQGLPDAAALVARVAGVSPLNEESDQPQ